MGNFMLPLDGIRQPGRIVATPAALAALEASGEAPLGYLDTSQETGET
jgi:hypothetical protein